MHLIGREARRSDFDAWLRMERECFGFGEDTPAGARREWNVLFSTDHALTLVVEDADRQQPDRMIAFGGAVLVSDAFAEWLLAGQPPYVNGFLADPPPGCPSPWIDAQALAAANRGEGVTCIITHWAWAERRLDAESGLRVRTYLRERFLDLHGGYNARRLLVEAVGPEARNRALAAGFVVYNDYSAYYATVPPPPDALRPCLLGQSREVALANDGIAISRAFVYTPPRFHFDAVEKEFLRYARLGKSDEELGDILCMSFGTVKKRWTSIYDRVDAADPTFLPPASGSVRGAEKRRKLLQYIREHPEELRG